MIRSAFTFALSVALMQTAAAAPQALAPVGVEFQINAITAGNQSRSAVSFDGAGRFVVVWQSYLSDGAGFGIVGRRFNSNGVPIGGEFVANTHTTGDQILPDVDVNASGAFVVAWEGPHPGGGAGAVFARRFNSSGTALGSAFIADTHTNLSVIGASVGIDADGDFVVAFSASGESFAQRFNSAGEKQGTMFEVTGVASGGHPSIDMENNGDFVVAWDGANVVGQRFNSSGAPLGGFFFVNSFFTGGGSRANPSVSVDSDGDFVVAYESPTQDGFNDGVFVSRFDSAGVGLGLEFQVATATIGEQRRPEAMLLDNGKFSVVWHSLTGDGDGAAVFARQFGPQGPTHTPELVVNSYTLGPQAYPSVGASPSGTFVVTWNSNRDSSAYGVFAQRLRVPPVLDIDGNGEIAALSDGLLVLRFMFGFTGTSLTAGAVANDCTRCDGASVTAYLQSLT